jgi:hypothetical protein
MARNTLTARSLKSQIDAVNAEVPGSFTIFEASVAKAGDASADFNLSESDGNETIVVGAIPAGAFVIQKPFFILNELFDQASCTDCTANIVVATVSSFAAPVDVETTHGTLGVKFPTLATAAYPIYFDTNTNISVNIISTGANTGALTAGKLTVKAMWFVPA